METSLSSNAAPALPGFRAILTAAALLLPLPLAAQSDNGVTPPTAQAPTPPAAQQPQQPRVNVLVTVPRGEVNQAQAQECEDRADASTISGEIVVCRQVGDDTSGLTGNREATQKRYAQETMLKGAPRAPDAFGIPNHGNPIGFGKAPPPAYIVDFQALPTAPVGSDADRIARGLPPLGKDGELSEEEERARREAAGIKTTAPAAPKKKP